MNMKNIAALQRDMLFPVYYLYIPRLETFAHNIEIAIVVWRRASRKH